MIVSSLGFKKKLSMFVSIHWNDFSWLYFGYMSYIFSILRTSSFQIVNNIFLTSIRIPALDRASFLSLESWVPAYTTIRFVN